MKIPYVNIANQNNKISKQLTSIFKNILDTGEYVGGKEIQKFERNIARDKRKNEELLDLGWNVLVFWECDIKSDISVLVDKVNKVLSVKEE